MDLETLVAFSLTSRSTIDFEAWRTRFRDEMRRNPRAKHSWEHLVAAGCSAEELIFGLALSCDFDGAPGFDFLREIRAESRRQTTRQARLAARLDAVAQEIRETLGNKQSGGVCEAISATIAELNREVRAARRETSARYLRPAVFLVFTVAYIEGMTGKPRYSDVASLVDLAYLTFDGAEPRPGAPLGSEAIRKTVERFKKRNPQFVRDDGSFNQERISQNTSMAAIILAVILVVAQRLAPPPPKRT